MSADAKAPNPGLKMPKTYRLCRSLVRFWFALSFHRIRLLNAQKAEEENPAIFAVSHPAGLLDALILISAFERPVHCVIEQSVIRGPMSGFLARRLGMMVFEDSGDGWRSVLPACCAALTGGRALIVFADKRTSANGKQRSVAQTVAHIAQEAEGCGPGQIEVSLFPLHLLLPVARSRSSELLIYVDSPATRGDRREGSDEASAPGLQALAAEIESRFRDNAFRLQPEDLRFFLEDLEEVLRADLAEDWASRPDWKQDTEGFRLSRLVKSWAEQVNFLNPGSLMSLRESLDSCREMRRRSALHRLEVEQAGTWLSSGIKRVPVYVESIVGLPVALYGSLNHLAILLVLYAAGSFRKYSSRDRTTEWVIRVVVVLGCYAAQVLLLAHFMGRAAAGYYAPTLPLTGAYLARYAWLLRRRTRLALLALLMPARAARARQMRKQFLDDLDRSLSLHEEMLGAPR